MEENQKVKTVLIASGSGTDAFAIMDAYSQGFLPDVLIEALISTKEGAGCIEKAEKFGIKTIVIDKKSIGDTKAFNQHLLLELNRIGCRLVFLVVCVVKIYPISGIYMYNIHPADPVEFGGHGMYGLKVHERVLARATDLILRGRTQLDGAFFTYPTIHEVTADYDSGQVLMTLAVRIPYEIINDLNLKKLPEVAKKLQSYVLPYEWMMLPTAVNIAAHKILHG
jgi:phosphoribosylglycinamide formyltransferase-1